MATANLLQTSVSGGTQNALSLQGDGVFFPKASTTSRLALTLTTTDKGFIVYDTTDNNIYFWNGTAWESIPGSGDAGANGSVQYNDNGTVSGATNFSYDKVTGAVSINSATGSLSVGTGTTTPLNIANASVTTERQIRIENSSVIAFLGVEPAAGGRFLGSAAGNAYFGTNAAYGLEFATNNNVRMTLNTTGNLAFKNGLGIDFSDTPGTGTSELLNDYEEGTWQGTLIGNITTPATPIVRTGKYTKIGRQVTVVIYFENVDTTGYSGAVSITGLPFTEDGGRAVGTVAFYNFDFNGGTGPIVDISGATMFFQSQLTNSNWRDVLHNPGALRFIRATLTYFV